MKKYYLYHEETKEFTSVFDAQPNPFRAGEYLQPANSTEKQPKIIENKTPLFDLEKGDWDYLPDFRNKILFSTETAEPISLKLGEELPKNSTDIKPPTDKTSKFNGREWVIMPEDENIYEWVNNEWVKIIPLFYGRIFADKASKILENAILKKKIPLNRTQDIWDSFAGMLVRLTNSIQFNPMSEADFKEFLAFAISKFNELTGVLTKEEIIEIEKELKNFVKNFKFKEV